MADRMGTPAMTLVTDVLRQAWLRLVAAHDAQHAAQADAERLQAAAAEQARLADQVRRELEQARAERDAARTDIERLSQALRGAREGRLLGYTEPARRAYYRSRHRAHR